MMHPLLIRVLMLTLLESSVVKSDGTIVGM